jgi:hypothetical protein
MSINLLDDAGERFRPVLVEGDEEAGAADAARTSGPRSDWEELLTSASTPGRGQSGSPRRVRMGR